MHVEIDTLDLFRERARTQGLGHAVVQGLDLREETAAVLAQPCTDAVFLGCQLDDDAARHVLETGGLIFPQLPDLPYRCYRPCLYSVEELMEGYEQGRHTTYADSLDQRIYAHFESFRHAEDPPILQTLAQRLHDHAIDHALADLLRGGGERRHVIAIMGGHSMLRTDAEYRQVARISQRLAAQDPRILMASGGGPGAMEACTLGAWLAGQGDAALDDALAVLARAPKYDDEGWFDTALEVRDAVPPAADSLGIPTWFYGHEPPNLFATHIAKYFSNSLREDGLLAIAKHGIIYAPGSAGTVQEIFQDGAQNHYGTFGDVSPMIFFGKRYWSEDKPVLAVLEKLAAGRQYAGMITVTDDVDEVVRFIVEHPPVPYAG